MPDESKAKTRKLINIAAFVGTLIAALIARPMIRPWLDAHTPNLTLKDWPILASFVPWILFSLYWEIQAKNSAPAISSESKASRAVHVVLSNVALFLIILPNKSLSQRFLPDSLIVQLMGFAAELAGLALAIWARRVLGRNWSGEITIKEDHELIRNGPYAKVRHPIYSGLLLMYAGTAMASGQMHGLLGLLIGIIAYLRKTRMEEANLVRGFGVGYDAYRKDTWAIVPGVY
jgi:protein-S-isoprenylcysteine O-methyltransferase Ste14